jgi:ribosomal protein S18 acetylase RimI-like enzyme
VELLDRIDSYCDAAPRSAARAEDFGPLVLFVRDGPGWPYYARPARGAGAPSPADVVRVRSRQLELGIPEAFEWIADVSPGMRAPAEAAGLKVVDHPLLVLRESAGRPATADVRLIGPDDEQLAEIAAVAPIAFANPGTAVGHAGADELAATAACSPAGATDELRERLRSGEAVLAAAFVGGRPASTGMHLPVDDVTEIVGVGTLPAARRRGLGAAVTALLVEDALRRGIETVFLSAGSEEIARVYESLGFERVGTACIAARPRAPRGAPRDSRRSAAAARASPCRPRRARRPRTPWRPPASRSTPSVR